MLPNPLHAGTPPRAPRAFGEALRSRSRVRCSWVLLASLALTACTTPSAPVAAPAAPLTNTRWVLQVIQSMDDAQPPARPTEPAHYTLSLGSDGRATLRLDCNRGATSWTATPAAGDSPGRVSGSLRFGEVASTRALCAPGSLAPRLQAALPHVRGYLLEGGRLHLSLLADGGILTWAPAP